VLAILAVPLIPTILVFCKRWRLGSDDVVVIGYDPMRIARQSPGILGIQEVGYDEVEEDADGDVSAR
jgi:hypothetical protein